MNFATVAGRAHLLAPGEAGFEDGTLNYLSIPAVSDGLAAVRGLYGHGSYSRGDIRNSLYNLSRTRQLVVSTVSLHRPLNEKMEGETQCGSGWRSRLPGP